MCDRLCLAQLCAVCVFQLVQRHLILMAVEVLVLSLALLLCLRRRAAPAVVRLPPARPVRQPLPPVRPEKTAPRRQTASSVTTSATATAGTATAAATVANGGEKPQKHSRRPSDEVVNIAGRRTSSWTLRPTFVLLVMGSRF